MEGVATLEEYVVSQRFVGTLLEPYGWDRPINYRRTICTTRNAPN